MSSDLGLAEIHETISAAVPDRDCIVFRDRRWSYAEVTQRSRRLANFLHDRGLGCHRARSDCAPWESGQDHLGLYLYNSNEFLEANLGAYKARVAPFNVNYRYVESELAYLFRDSRAKAIVYHAEFAPRLAKVRDQLPHLELLLQVRDGSGEELLPGALDYEEALASASAARPDLVWSPDDLYIVYTGGTTGAPKGVLWRQGDILVTALGGLRPDGRENSLQDYRERARKGGKHRFLTAPPLMHGAAQWVAFNQFHAGNTVVLHRDPRRADPDDLWSTVERERATEILIVGDAFAQPLLDQLRRKDYDLSSLRSIFSGGAILSERSKRSLLDVFPGIRIVDVMGSSETGSQAEAVSVANRTAATGRFAPRSGACVLNADLSRVLGPDDDEIGWLARRGRVPLGYLGDPEKTSKTFPTVEGERFSIPGDRARWAAGGEIELLGRESVTINSGGEKIFAEEVERAIKLHPSVYDAIVCDRPSDRWGKEVVAVVRLREGAPVEAQELIDSCAPHLARFKLPKAVFFRDEIRRSPSGKPDYDWARQQAVEGDRAS